MRWGTGVMLIWAAVALFGAPSASGNSAGAPDPTFGAAGSSTAALGSWAAATAAVLQSAGRIVTVGEADVNGRYELISTRMTHTGALDMTYGRKGWVEVDVGGLSGGNAVIGLPGGKLLMAGTGARNGKLEFLAVRVLPSGRLDRRFGRHGIVTVPIGNAAIANAIVREPDGKILLVGTSNASGQNHFTVVRLTAAGRVDRTYGSDGIVTLSPAGAAWGAALQPDGALVIGGQEDSLSAPGSLSGLFSVLNRTLGDPQGCMAARLLADGHADPRFGRGGIVRLPVGPSSLCDALAIQPDGEIVLAGTSTWLLFTDVIAIRLRHDGSADTGFGSHGTFQAPGNGLNAMTIDRQGRILLAGVGASAARLLPAGSFDPSFGYRGVSIASFGTRDAANGIAIQPSDGRILLAGAATIDSRTVLQVIRLQP